MLVFLNLALVLFFFFFSSRRRHTRLVSDWSSDVCSSDLQVISRELRGEKIDIIEWSHDPATFVARALSPAKVSSVTIGEPGESEAEATALIVVPDNQLSLAIGKKGQNARLAAKLTGMRIDIKSEAELAAPAPAEDDRRTALSRLAGDLTPAMIDALVAAGLDSPEAIKRAGRERLAEIAGLGDRADKLYTAAEEWTTAHASEGRPDGGADPE